MITCPHCCADFDENDPESTDEDTDQWCDSCNDLRPFEDGVCARCGES